MVHGGAKEYYKQRKVKLSQSNNHAVDDEVEAEE